MGRLYSSWLGRAALATAAVAMVLTGSAEEPGPVGALLVSMIVAAAAVVLRKRRLA